MRRALALLLLLRAAAASAQAQSPATVPKEEEINLEEVKPEPALY